jgi:Fe-S-cluster-containing hydrogenase component 2
MKDVEKEVKENPESSSPGVTRRDFIIRVGTAAVGGVIVAAAAGCAPAEKVVEKEVTREVPKEVVKEVPKEVIKEVPVELKIARSGVIEWNSKECAACSRCVMACAAYHEGAVAPQLSAIKWVENDYLYGFRFRKPLHCKQCDYPECYFACPLKDKALCIDSATGARYINKKECTGCGLCIEACPLDEPRINLDEQNKVAIKCDLCKDRAGGPVCVEVCDRKAVAFVSREGRA